MRGFAHILWFPYFLQYLMALRSNFRPDSRREQPHSSGETAHFRDLAAKYRDISRLIMVYRDWSRRSAVTYMGCLTSFLAEIRFRGGISCLLS